MRRALAGLVLAAVALAGCTSAAEQAGKKSDRLVDFSKKPPYVNALEIDPANGDFLLTTNRGFWRVDKETKKVTKVVGHISEDGKRDTVGTFLEIDSVGRGELIGSGHPDSKGRLQPFLGFIRSTDNGKTWKVVSRYGDADLHKIIIAHDRMYAFDAVLSALLVSRDDGKTFTENFTPRGLIIDFAVDPDDPDYVLADTDDQLFRSDNGGKSWRAILNAKGVRLSWPEHDKLFRGDRDGSIYTSADRGQTWKLVSRVKGEPYKFKPVSADELYLALSDGSILHTRDGGRSWQDAFRPE